MQDESNTAEPDVDRRDRRVGQVPRPVAMTGLSE
jgi:hypothetical protein